MPVSGSRPHNQARRTQRTQRWYRPTSSSRMTSLLRRFGTSRSFSKQALTSPPERVALALILADSPDATSAPSLKLVCLSRWTEAKYGGIAVDCDQEVSRYCGLVGVAGFLRIVVRSWIKMEAGLLPVGWRLSSKSPHCRVVRSAMRLDLGELSALVDPPQACSPIRVCSRSFLPNWSSVMLA